MQVPLSNRALWGLMLGLVVGACAQLSLDRTEKKLAADIAASEQLPDVERLRRAARLMSQAAVMSNPGDQPERCRRARDAVALFQEAAFPSLINEALAAANASAAYNSARRPFASLAAILENCESPQDVTLVRSVTYLLAPIFDRAREVVQASHAFPPIKDDPERYRPLSRPVTVDGVLQNVKWLAENGVVLRDDFYVRENTARLSGTDSVVTRYVTSIQAHWRAATSAAGDCEFGIGRGNTEAGKITTGGFSMSCRDSESNHVHPADVGRIFGHDWKSEEDVQGPRHHGPMLPPNVPYGNTTMIYDFPDRSTDDGAQFSRRLYVSFSTNARLKDLTFSMARR